jgi:hypothetical protein
MTHQNYIGLDADKLKGLGIKLNLLLSNFQIFYINRLSLEYKGKEIFLNFMLSLKSYTLMH